MINSKITLLSITFILLFSLNSCREDYFPKPKGFIRIDLPKKNYIKYESSSPYSFEFPDYVTIGKKKDSNPNVIFEDLLFPSLNAVIHLTYFKVENGKLREMTEGARKFVYDHTQKAGGIKETEINNSLNNTYGLYYKINGDAASNIQFYYTDSTNHFTRGSLYFMNKPNYDSLKPYLDFIEEDIYHLMNTWEWKSENE